MKKAIQIALICATSLMSSVYSAETPKSTTPEWIEITTCMTLGNRVAYNTRTRETRDLPQRPLVQQQQKTPTTARNNPLANLVNFDELPKTTTTTTTTVLNKSTAKPELTIFGLHEMNKDWTKDDHENLFHVMSIIKDIRETCPQVSVFKFLIEELDVFVGQQNILGALGLAHLAQPTAPSTTLKGTASEYLTAAMTFEGLYVRHAELKENPYFIRMMAEMFRRFVSSGQSHQHRDAIEFKWMEYDGKISHLYPQG